LVLTPILLLPQQESSGLKQPGEGNPRSHSGRRREDPTVNFINILQAAFLPIFFCHKNYKAKLSVDKSFKKHFGKKNESVKC